ncbi:DUF7594 domain-containing protein [Luteimonas salinilitoris]|uniref:DNRLRE domain-containing protein n=1 Tax=Luteimonas salinilitoris TaxID=3237697 RepID=A0ABV4HSB8_9GAMM
MSNDFDLRRRRLLGAGVGLTTTGLVVPHLGLGGRAFAAETTGSALTPEVLASWQSIPVSFDQSGKLVYRSDQEGNRIPDFSYAGYHNGERPLPNVPVKRNIRPVPGDNTQNIQSAINDVGGLPKDANGFRGTVLMEAGEYEVTGTIHIRNSGVVLRGVGDGANQADNTVIRSVRNSIDSVVRVSKTDTDWLDHIPDTRINIITDLVPVGARTFRVEDAASLAVGDNIMIVHPCTQEWLEAVDGGGTAYDPPWGLYTVPIVYNRFIAAISGNHITIDAPVFNHLNRNLSQCYLYRWDGDGLITEVGVENLRIDIAYTGSPDEDEDHAWNAIKLLNVQDSWIKNCTMLHFGLSGVITYRATRVTVANCKAIDPVSIINGSKRYNFNVQGSSQQILFVDCLATKARHAFVSNGNATASGIVFLRCTSQYGYLMSEGHKKWTQGMLYDGFTEIDPNNNGNALGFYNRGSFGGGHGWAAAHSVAWNAVVPSDQNIIIQKPPTAQNYAIGCFGHVTGTGFFEHPAGYIKGTDEDGLKPESLYLAQIDERRSTSYTHFPVIHDAYVQGGSYSNINFGGRNVLMIKHSEYDEFKRWAYLKFNLVGVNAGRLKNVRLRLSARHISPENSGFQGAWVRVYAVADTSWAEDTITWSNRPALQSDALDSRPVAGPMAEFEWDVTDWVRSELEAGRTLISLALTCAGSRSSPVYAHSKNQSDGVGPQLLVDAG